MPRRVHDDPSAGESDSFLDIVANIVGILIILIVIVGVRVGQWARTASTSPPAATAPLVAKVPVVAPRPVAPATPDAELAAQLERMTTKIGALRAKASAAAGKRETLTEAIAGLREELTSASADQKRLGQSLAAAESAWRTALAKQDQLARTARSLQETLGDLPARKVKTVRHELNPIGQKVRGEEVHFRLAEGRVSFIPLKTLITQLKRRIGRRKELIARVGRHEGLIGPFDGYTMKFVIERGPASPADDLRLGPRMIRIRVTGWKVIPQATLQAETVEQALRTSSHFRQALRQAGYGTALTFWVYPDSFSEYRQLKEFAHSLGFAVAARPLPPNVPIAGSPNGSRSRSQ